MSKKKTGTKQERKRRGKQRAIKNQIKKRRKDNKMLSQKSEKGVGSYSTCYLSAHSIAQVILLATRAENYSCYIHAHAHTHSQRLRLGFFDVKLFF
jgi:hypothetical protein